MNNIIFHIGYPKSASTTLQHQFFTQLPGHYYLGVGMEKPHHNNQLVSENFKELVLNLFKTDTLSYDHAKTLTNWLNVKKHIPSDSPIIISHEKALGTIFSLPDPFEKARRIRNVFGDIKILMIIRNQHNIALSQYRDWPFQPNYHLSGKPVSFKKWIDLDMKQKYSSFIRTLDYNRINEIYCDLFTPDNVSVLPIELLQSDPASFSKELSNIFSIDPAISKQLIDSFKNLNQGATHHQIKLKQLKRKYKFIRYINKRIPASMKNYVRSLFPSTNRLSSEEDKAFFREHFSKSNNELSEIIKIDLLELGY